MFHRSNSFEHTGVEQLGKSVNKNKNASLDL